MGLVTVLTLSSVSLYLVEWVRHMSTIEARSRKATRPEDEYRARRVIPGSLPSRLPHAESLTRDDFLEGPANAAGLALIDCWPDWPNRIMMLVGPEGAGKSHLAAIWAEQAGARSIAAHCADRDRASRRRSRPARWWSRTQAGRISTSARCFICSISRARTAPSCCSPRARRRRRWTIELARPALAPARRAGGGAGAAGRRAVPRA